MTLGTGPIGTAPIAALARNVADTINGDYVEEGYVEPDYFAADENGSLKPPQGQVFLTDGDGRYLTDADGAFLTGLIDNGTQGLSAADLDATSRTLSSEWTGVPADRQLLITTRTLVPPAIQALEAMIAQLEFGHNRGPRIAEDHEKLEALRALHSGLGQILEVADRGDLGSDLGFGLISEVRGYAKRACEMVKGDPVKWGLTTLITAACASLGDLSIWGGLAVTTVQSVRSPKQKHD